LEERVGIGSGVLEGSEELGLEVRREESEEGGRGEGVLRGKERRGEVSLGGLTTMRGLGAQPKASIYS